MPSSGVGGREDIKKKGRGREMGLRKDSGEGNKVMVGQLSNQMPIIEIGYDSTM